MICDCSYTPPTKLAVLHYGMVPIRASHEHLKSSMLANGRKLMLG